MTRRTTNGEMSEEEENRNVFGEADEEEEKKAKKRVRAVESSDEEGEESGRTWRTRRRRWRRRSRRKWMMCSVTTIAAVCNKEQNYAYCFLHFEKENPPQAAMTRIRITTRTMTTIITTLRAFCHHILFLRARASELKMKACWSRSQRLVGERLDFLSSSKNFVCT